MLSEKTNYFPALTGVRAIAAFLVFFHHNNPFGKSSFDFLKNSVIEWHIGVTIFFVLSGFLISFRYYSNLGVRFGQYILNRFARVYPVYFIFTTLTFIIDRNCYANSLFLVYFSNITLVRGFFSELAFTGIKQAWSLTVEECFYFSAPVFFYLIRKNLNWIWISPIILVLIGIFLVHSEINIYGPYPAHFVYLYTFLGRCTEFFIGIGLGIGIRKLNFTHGKPYFTIFGILFITFSIFLLVNVKETARYGLHEMRGMWINNLLLPLFGISVFFAGLIFENSWVRTFLSSKIMVLLGKSSYIFYLIHMGVIADVLVKSFGMGIYTKFIALNVLSIYIFKYIEEPLNHYIKSLYKGAKVSVRT